MKTVIVLIYDNQEDYEDHRIDVITAAEDVTTGETMIAQIKQWAKKMLKRYPDIEPLPDDPDWIDRVEARNAKIDKLRPPLEYENFKDDIKKVRIPQVSLEIHDIHTMKDVGPTWKRP